MIDSILNQLWGKYIHQNPHAKKVYDLFSDRGENVINDHIAFRTFAHPKINIEKLAAIFTKNGFEQRGSYQFTEKNLKALHYQHPTNSKLPKVFISELNLDAFSIKFKDEIVKLVEKIPDSLILSDEFVFSGVPWGSLSHNTYNLLAKESEYAAWLYANGFVANHFTVSVNHLKTFSNLQEVNEFLKHNGFILNANPDEIKGSPKLFLEQSSIKAGRQSINFTDGAYQIPTCYYEFARRYNQENGELFEGFIAESANKIFESTDNCQKD
jgi:hypothetical protein